MQEKSSVYLPLTLTFLGLRHASLAKERSKGKERLSKPLERLRGRLSLHKNSEQTGAMHESAKQP